MTLSKKTKGPLQGVFIKNIKQKDRSLSTSRKILSWNLCIHGTKEVSYKRILI